MKIKNNSIWKGIANLSVIFFFILYQTITSCNVNNDHEKYSQYDGFYDLFSKGYIKKISTDFKRILRDTTVVNLLEYDSIFPLIDFLDTNDSIYSIEDNRAIRSYLHKVYADSNMYNINLLNIDKTEVLKLENRYIPGWGNDCKIIVAKLFSGTENWSDNCFFIENEAGEILAINADKLFWDEYGFDYPLFGIILDGVKSSSHQKYYLRIKNKSYSVFYYEDVDFFDKKSLDAFYID